MPTVKELKASCLDRGLPTSGDKPTIERRLGMYDYARRKRLAVGRWRWRVGRRSSEQVRATF